LWGGSIAYFAATDRLNEFVEAVFRVNVGYADASESFFWRFVEFFSPRRSPFVFDTAIWLWLAGLGGFMWMLIDALRARSVRQTGELLLLAANYLAICLPGQFWPHYYYLMIPSLCITVSIALDRVAESVQAGLKRWSPNCPATFWGMAIRFAASAAMIGLLFVSQYDAYLGQPLPQITARRYRGLDFWARDQAENVRRVTEPEDSIFVYSDDASIYYYARRKGASRYTMMTALHPRIPGSEQRRRTLLEDLRRQRPRVILFRSRDSFDELTAFLAENYVEAGFDLSEDPPHRPVMGVLCDRRRPIALIDWDWKPPTPSR
jgi:hypothetical protein